MFLVVSRSDAHFGLDVRLVSVLRTRLGAQVKLHARKAGRLERNLPTPGFGGQFSNLLNSL